MALLAPSIYRHTQSSASAVWAVQHNLGANGGQGVPIVDVFIDDGGQISKMIPKSVEIVDRFNLNITFTTARTGFAVVVV